MPLFLIFCGLTGIVILSSMAFKAFSERLNNQDKRIEKLKSNDTRTRKANRNP